MIEKLEQVDPVLTEDGAGVVFYGYTSEPDETFVAWLALPQPITEAEFELAVNEWRSVPWPALDWRQA